MNMRLKLKVIERFQTQADFAAAIGEDESTVSRAIRGRRQLSADKKKTWADSLGCKPHEIFED